jgi:hypothetical protein
VQINANLVASPFLYADDLNEFDIEFSRVRLLRSTAWFLCVLFMLYSASTSYLPLARPGWHPCSAKQHGEAFCSLLCSLHVYT